MQDQDDDRPKASPLRRATGRFLLFGVMLPGLLLAVISVRRTHDARSDWTAFGIDRDTLGLIGLALFFAPMLILFVMQKISPIAIPKTDAAEMTVQRQRFEEAMRGRLNRRLRWFLPLGAGILTSLPLIGLLRMLQPTTPMLEGLSTPGIERVGLLLGFMVALVGYGMFRLLRRGDSGNG